MSEPSSPQPQPAKSATPPEKPGSPTGFADTFRRKPARGPRGLTPGPRVWSATAWTAAVAAVGAVAALVVVPLLLAGNDDDQEERAQTVVAASETPESPSPSPSVKESKKPEKPSPSATPVTPAPPAPPAPGPEVASSPEAPAPSASRKSAPEEKEEKEEKKAPEWTRTVISATNILSTGESWKTNRIRMTMQQDGNLVVYNEDDNALWASATFGEGHTARFQQDGNLVIHNGDDRPIWASQTNGNPGAQLVLRKDGKVVIVAAGGNVVWSS
ncbi:mannose-binding protein [Streptomyces acidicola]|uniref:mannose-binding protein n=1 Tax=Streptomyces acidicola TaxID=2596892 RepID=UPI0038117BDA